MSANTLFANRLAPCKHFDDCGGCALQDVSYSNQIAKKQTSLSNLFLTLLPSLPDEKVVIHPSVSEFAYRSRMDFIINEDLQFGLRASGKSFTIVPCDICLLLSDCAQELMKHVQEHLFIFPNAKELFPAYNLRLHKGFLRFFSLRESANKKFMVFFTTTKPENSDQEESFKSFLQEIFDTHASVTSLHWLINDEKADDIGYQKPYHTIGDELLEDSILGLSFFLGPRTFFQSNRFVAEDMFKEIVKESEGKVLDLCSGVGAISLAVAKSPRVSQVHGVELFKESVLAAEENAKRNAITNTKFLASDAKDFLFTALKNKLTFDTIILDPPRTGMGLDAMKLAARLLPTKVIYMSCNPQTLRSDIEPLLENYELASLEGYDMFPQTNHLEALCILKKK